MKDEFNKKLEELFNKIKKFWNKKRPSINNIIEIWFPDHIELCKKAGVKQKTIDKIERLDKIIRRKYTLLILIILLIIFFLGYTFIQSYLKGEFSLRFVYFMFQMFSIFFIFMGTFFLSKGLIKNYYQIALESSTTLGYNLHVMKDLIESIHRSKIGFFFIMISVLIQLISIAINYFNLLD